MVLDSMIRREPINKGWSGDRKYCVTDDSGIRYLLRVSPREQLEKKRNQFARMLQAAELGIPMCLPVEFGQCDEGVYSIQSWVSGADAEEYIPTLPNDRQYAYGLDAGQILAKLHTLPAPQDAEDWEIRFNRKIDRKIAMYESCPLKYEVDQPFLRHIERSRHLLAGRPQSYQHGDYHIGNMMVDDAGVLTVIDFDRDDWGDPWEEFNRIVWSAQASPAFAAGMVDGYFKKQVPMEFWELLALYICSNTLSSLPWAIPFGEEEINTMRRQASEILGWYDNMNTSVPSWYRDGKGLYF